MENNLHFIGIGGIGMSAIARIMLGQGFDISGSDLQESRLTRTLAGQGARISYGHAPQNLPADARAVVYSSAVEEDNLEMKEARRRGLTVYKRAEMLAYLIGCKRGIGVAGSHGKTTVSGMIATMLELTGQNPTIIIGGMLPLIGSNAKAGAGPCLVAEADESDGTFLLLKPEIAVVTNIESDHLDYYRDLRHLKQTFAQYLRQLPQNGFAVVCADCPQVREVMDSVPGRYITYGLQTPARYTAAAISHCNTGVSADVYDNGTLLGRFSLSVPGEHNVANALAALAVGRELGLGFDEIAQALSRFSGTGRRFEIMGEKDGVTVVDDYAHHPTELAATIGAAGAMYKKRRIVAVFQPHRYSRTQVMYAGFAQALTEVGAVVIQEIYPAFEQPIPGVSARLIVEEAQRLGYGDIYYAEEEDQTLAMLARLTRPGDLLLIMGAGNIRTVAERFLAPALDKEEKR
ncbi:MAG: UDP-N-acetylmuramate--L-alanine ligase [Clostridiales bacterium]|nr:UDP-N-acetylmuramate--L-alanine ligase [Clostridiales bacterium]